MLGGVVADPDRGLEATSDGDVAAHALCDALLGAAGLGDMGTHFPSSGDRFVGADSMELLGEVARLLSEAGWRVGNVDVTVVSQSVRVSPIRGEMRERLATVLDIGLDAASVKATTTDAMGAVGRDEGVAATAVVLIHR